MKVRDLIEKTKTKINKNGKQCTHTFEYIYKCVYICMQNFKPNHV